MQNNLTLFLMKRTNSFCLLINKTIFDDRVGKFLPNKWLNVNGPKKQFRLCYITSYRHITNLLTG